MASGRYKFVRDGKNVTGFLSANRASTDALGALGAWSGAQSDRGYTVVIDEDEQLLADLSWSEVDSSAGPDLDCECFKFGLSRIYVDP